MPTLSLGGVAFTIAVDGGVREAQPDSGPQATVTFKCAYGDRYALLRAMLPQATWVGGAVVRVPGYAYPPSPNLFAWTCSGIKGIAPKADPDGWLVCRQALVSVDFRVPTFAAGFGSGGLSGGSIDPEVGNCDPSGQPWTSTRIEVGGEVIKVPSGGYKLTDGTPLEESAAGLIQPQFTIRMKRHYMPLVPLAQADALMGTVNNAPIKFANKTFAKGTLLFAGLTSDQSVDTAANVVAEVEYEMLGRGRGIEWNQFLAADGTWKYANTATDLSGSYPFPYSADFTKEALP